MVSSTSAKKQPPRLSTKDYMIRSTALDLLQRATPDHQIVYENDDDENSDFSWITPEEPISYQHDPAAPAIEQRRQPARIAAQDQWIDVFLPAVSCISNACRVGVSTIVKQTTDGYHTIKNDLRESRLDRGTMKEANTSYRPRNFKRDSNQGYHAAGIRRRATAGQQTAERYPTSAYAEEEDILCYHPGEWRPSGLLFVPAEEVRQYQYDDVSVMTDDGSRATKKCLGFCPPIQTSM